MKRAPLFLGCTLLVTLLCTLGWAVVGVKAFTITQIKCQSKGQTCSTEVSADLDTMLTGKSLFITDFKQVVPAEKIEVVSFSKEVPGLLRLEVEQTNTNMLINTSATIPSDPTKVTTSITDQLSKAGVSFNTIELKPEANVVMIQFEKERALVRLNQAELDTKKVILIKQHLRLSEIDTGIVEIDARYQMPVLRTTATSL